MFDLRQMNKAFRKWTNGYKAIEKFNAACKAELESLHATRSVGTAAVTCGILGIIVGIASAFYFIAAEHNFALALCISLPITVLCLFALVYCTTTGITDSGQQYAGQVRGPVSYTHLVRHVRADVTHADDADLRADSHFLFSSLMRL